MGSKQSLLPFIADCLKLEGIEYENVLDAFSGTTCVAYMFKKLGKQVHANDFLNFCYHTANATIANNDFTLTNKDITALLKENPKGSNFIRDTFRTLYFTEKDSQFLDNLRANINELRNPFKKSLILASITRACMKKRPRGIFTFTGKKGWDGRKDLKLNLEDHFINACKLYNAAVFNNGKTNNAFNEDVFDIDPQNYDLVYIDTPYISPYSDCDYVRRYHFVEGYCRNWQGLQIITDSTTKKFKSYPTAFSSQRTATESFLRLFDHFRRSILVVSYSSNCLPQKEEMIQLLKNFKRKVRCCERDHKYCFGNHSHRVGNNNNQVKEYVFIAR